MSAERPYQERARAYAETLSKRFHLGILNSMQEKPLWGLYRMEQDERGNWHKRPYQPNGRAASKNRPEHWSGLDNVLEAVALAKFRVSGIGILLPAPYVLIDLDAKEDAPIYDRQARKIVSPLALRVMEQVPTYFELSPNFGLHGITEGRPRGGNFKTERLEMYTNWFSTVTTRHIPGTPLDVTNRQEAIEALENEFHPITPETVRQNTGGAMRGGTQLPPEAKGDRMLHDLLSGDTSMYQGDTSRAEFVALMKLMHYTGDDRAWAKAIFSSYPIGERAKAREDTREGRRGDSTYLDYTIDAVVKKRRNPPMRR